MIYIDSSSLLKLLRNEKESPAVVKAVAAEQKVLISVLTELETLVHLKAAWLGRDYNLARLRRLEAQLAFFRNKPPHEFRSLSSSVFQTALRQHRNAADVHCRSMDRLHLAAMEELKVRRLMTHDERQGNAALE